MSSKVANKQSLFSKKASGNPPLAFSDRLLKIACHASFLIWNILRRTKPQNFEPFTTTTFITKTSQLCSAP